MITASKRRRKYPIISDLLLRKKILSYPSPQADRSQCLLYRCRWDTILRAIIRRVNFRREISCWSQDWFCRYFALRPSLIKKNSSPNIISSRSLAISSCSEPYKLLPTSIRTENLFLLRNWVSGPRLLFGSGFHNGPKWQGYLRWICIARCVKVGGWKTIEYKYEMVVARACARPRNWIGRDPSTHGTRIIDACVVACYEGPSQTEQVHFHGSSIRWLWRIPNYKRWQDKESQTTVLPDWSNVFKY